MGRVIKAWESAHPGVSVRWIDVPWSSVERKLLAAVFARTAPDLVNLNPPFAANLASKGGLLNFDGVLPPEAAAAYLPEVWQGVSVPAKEVVDPPPSQVDRPWGLRVRGNLAPLRNLEKSRLPSPLSWERPG
jgi:putative chitobiose transport system substrate-binding protein